MSLHLGHIKLSRKLFRSDPWWAEERVFSRFEAWIDILQLAAWKPRVVLYHGDEIPLERGELILSIRLAAARWSWSEKGTRTFLKRAQERARLTAQRETQAGTVYLVVNYDTYQSSREPKGTPEDTPEGTPNGIAGAHQGHTGGTPRAQERSSKAVQAVKQITPSPSPRVRDDEVSGDRWFDDPRVVAFFGAVPLTKHRAWRAIIGGWRSGERRLGTFQPSDEQLASGLVAAVTARDDGPLGEAFVAGCIRRASRVSHVDSETGRELTYLEKVAKGLIVHEEIA